MVHEPSLYPVIIVSDCVLLDEVLFCIVLVIVHRPLNELLLSFYPDPGVGAMS